MLSTLHPMKIWGIGGFGFLGILPRVSFKPDPSIRSDAFVSPWPSLRFSAWLISLPTSGLYFQPCRS